MIALTQRLVERDEQIMALQDELDAYDRRHKELEEKLDEKTASLIKYATVPVTVCVCVCVCDCLRMCVCVCVCGCVCEYSYTYNIECMSDCVCAECFDCVYALFFVVLISLPSK